MSDADEVRVEPVLKEKERKDRQSLLERQFIMKQKGDYTLYYDKNKPDKVAIREYKDCIVGVDKDNNIAIKAIVERIQEKGWTSIKMSGNKALQVALAAEALDKGITVEGYEKPKKQAPELEKDFQEKTEEPEQPAPDIEGAEAAKEDERIIYPGDTDHPDYERLAMVGPGLEDGDFEKFYGPVTNSFENTLKKEWEEERDRTAEAKATTEQAARDRKQRLEDVTARVNSPTLEEKGARENAYNTLSRTEAIQQYPELTPVYEIVGKAREHLEDNRHKFTDEMAEAFIQSARNSCFEQLNKGVDLQGRLDKVREQRSAARDNAASELSLEA